MNLASGLVAQNAGNSGLSSLWFLGLVFVLAAVGLISLWLWGRRSRPADDDIAEFARGLEALAPRADTRRSRGLVSHGRNANRQQR